MAPYGRLLASLLWWTRGRCQVTWGPGPLHLSDVDDLGNQRRLADLLQTALALEERSSLQPAILAEIADFRQRVEARPSLALAVAMAEYQFGWYGESGASVELERAEDAANLMYASIQFSGCGLLELSPELFRQRTCGARWLYTVMLYSELGRELAARYLTEQAAGLLEKAVAAFEMMKRLPYFSPLTHWQSPYDMNFNEEWFPGTSRPTWQKASVPLARLLEERHGAIAAEVGEFDAAHFRTQREEGRDSAPPGGRVAVEIMSQGAWDAKACARLPKTCELLKGSQELAGCERAAVSLVDLKAGAALKPRFGAAPKLLIHLPLRADIGAKLGVGNETLALRTGQVVVVDDTFIHQHWHAGVRGGELSLQVAVCHPCEAAQRQFYGEDFACPPEAASVAVPFAAAALWAAGLPELALCNGGIGESCPADSQHGGPNPLSAVNTWNYALNNLLAAVKAANVPVDPALYGAVQSVQSAIAEFLRAPLLGAFGQIVAAALQIFEAMSPWLRQQGPSEVAIPKALLAAQRSERLPSDGAAPSSVLLTLANGVQMPAVGFGTWKLTGQACYDAVREALKAGVRHIDTAEAYQNEAEIGRALRDSGLPRQELFLATKATSVPLGMAGLEELQGIFAGQLQQLQTEYVDVYMLHAAGVRGEALRAVWQAMEALQDLGRVRALGVSNFGIEELEELWAMARLKPLYVQNILKVYKPGEQIYGGGTLSVMEWARSHGAVFVGYSVINAWPHLLPPLSDPHVLALSRAKGRSPSQLLHRWALQKGAAVIPKASSRERIRENVALFDFALSPPEMAVLDGLATLSESGEGQLRPAWAADVFGLRQPAGAFQVLQRDSHCQWLLPQAKAESFSLGGGGHQLAQCQEACAAQASCRFLTFYEATGYCHMFRDCSQRGPAGDGAVIYARL